MSPERIQELVRILWNEVESGEQLHEFILKYADELDQDFLTGIAALVQLAKESGNENAGRFFSQIGQSLLAADAIGCPEKSIAEIGTGFISGSDSA